MDKAIFYISDNVSELRSEKQSQQNVCRYSEKYAEAKFSSGVDGSGNCIGTNKALGNPE